jgi:hypothetical protein
MKPDIWIVGQLSNPILEAIYLLKNFSKCGRKVLSSNPLDVTAPGLGGNLSTDHYTTLICSVILYTTYMYDGYETCEMHIIIRPHLCCGTWLKQSESALHHYFPNWISFRKTNKCNGGFFIFRVLL